MTTSEVAGYLRLKERTVYDMVARQQIPCSRATGKLLFSRAVIDAWVESHTEMPTNALLPAPLIYAGSSDPLLEWALRQSGSGIATLICGSRRGLVQFATGQSLLGGIHLFDEDSQSYNIPQIKASLPQSDVVAVHWADRVQGLILPKDNPAAVGSLNDVVQKKLRFARRSEGTGSQALLEILLSGIGCTMDDLNIPDPVAESETDLAAMIAMGSADCAMGIAAAARGLDFVPLWPSERFDLVMRRRDYFEPPVQSLLKFAQSPEFHRQGEYLGGYDLSDLGTIRYNG